MNETIAKLYQTLITKDDEIRRLIRESNAQKEHTELQDLRYAQLEKRLEKMQNSQREAPRKPKPNLPKVPLRISHRPKPLPSLPKPKFTKRRANPNPHRNPLPSRLSLNPLNLNRFSPNLSPKMSWTICFNQTTRRPAAALSVICILFPFRRPLCRNKVV